MSCFLPHSGIFGITIFSAYDLQASLTISLGHPQPDNLPVTLSDMVGKVLNDQPITPGEDILHHSEGVDLIPSDIQLSGMEVSLVNAMSRETILRQYLDTVRRQYTHILLDCQLSLGMLTVNALDGSSGGPCPGGIPSGKGAGTAFTDRGQGAAADQSQLLIDGILLTMVDSRTNFAKEISAEGKNIFTYDPGGKMAEAYGNLTREVLRLEKQRAKSRAGISL